MSRSLLRALGINFPIIQAPMAGGGDTPALVAAVSNAGGLGCFGAAYTMPTKIMEIGTLIRENTDSPFAVNLFAPQPIPNTTHEKIEAATRRLERYYEATGVERPKPAEYQDNFEEQLEACLSIGAKTLTFTFGKLSPHHMRRIRDRGLLSLGTATTVREAMELQETGVDGVIAQSFEAGDHRATFRETFESSMIGGLALLPQMVDAVSIPVIASGGIMDGRGIVAALALGADAVQMGTAFLTAKNPVSARHTRMQSFLHRKKTSSRPKLLGQTSTWHRQPIHS